VRKRRRMVVVGRLLAAAIVLTGYLSSLCAAQLNSADSKSNDAFREQLAAIGQSCRAGDTATVQKLIDQFRLPNPREWFSEHLGAEQSSELTMRYDRLFANFAESLQHTVESIAANPDAELVAMLENGKGESPTDVRRPGAKLSGMVSIHPPPLFYGHFKITKGKADTTSWADSFVLEDGAFRFIGVGAWPFWVWQDGTEGSLPKGGSFSTPPILISRVSAVYPPDARSRNIEGVVTLRLVIDKEGRVKKADVQSGDALLTQAALDAVRQWRYKPATLAGAPSESDAIVNISFSLRR
jgi:TonB family protein